MAALMAENIANGGHLNLSASASIMA